MPIPPAGPILAVSVEDLAEKEAVLAAQPKAFFTISHFDGYAAVLIQLRSVTQASPAGGDPRRVARERAAPARGRLRC